MPPSNHQKRTADTLVSTSPGESSTSTPAEVSLEHQDTRKRRRVTTSARVQSPDSNVIDIDNHELQALANEVSNGSLDLRQMKIKEEQAAAEKAAKEEAERKEQRKNWTRLAAFQCAICMDSATNLTVTHCGHMFCMECLTCALNVEAERNRCPMCRQKVDNKARSTWTSRTKGFWPLEIKIKMRPRKDSPSLSNTQNKASGSNTPGSQPGNSGSSGR